MQVREFLEKLFSARLEQEVVIHINTHGDNWVAYDVKNVRFEGDNVIVESTE